jgi:ribosome-associated protein
MTSDELSARGLLTEVVFSAGRSVGPGGQNVNKVNTRIELRFNVEQSEVLTTEEKQILTEKLANRISVAGEIVMRSSVERSQLQNKEDVCHRFLELIAKALRPRKKRKATKPSRASVERRLESKKKRSEIKQNRRNSD